MTDSNTDHERLRAAAGLVDGQHYTKHVPSVKAAISAGDVDEAVGILLRLVDAVEREASVPWAGAAVPPWYHKTLATQYRKRGMQREAGLMMQRYAVVSTRFDTASAIAMARLRASFETPRDPAPSVRRPSQKAASFGFWFGSIFRRITK